MLKQAEWSRSEPVFFFPSAVFEQFLKSLFQDQHAVAIAEKPHPLPDGRTVGVHRMLVTGKGADQHQKRALGKMKIRQQNIGGEHRKRRMNEDFRTAGGGMEETIRRHTGLQNPESRGADRRNPMSAPARLVQQGRGLFREGILLGVHLMIGDLLLRHRFEGARADMQSQLRAADALFLQSVQNLPSEMESGGRSRHRAGLFGVNGLIPLRIRRQTRRLMYGGSGI